MKIDRQVMPTTTAEITYLAQIGMGEVRVGIKSTMSGHC